jgi:hypothetical protein
MSLFNRLLGKEASTKTRTRICVECGMPPADHKDWCAIHRAELEMKNRTGDKDAGASS